MLPFALAEGKRARKRGGAGGVLTRGHYARFMLLGVVFFFGITVQQYGLLSTSVTNAGFLTAIYVVMTPIIAYLAFAERPHPVVWPASLTTLGGIWLLGGGSLASLGAGDLLMVVCAVFWAMHVCLIGRFAADSGRPFALSSCQFAVVGVIGLLPGLILEPVSLATLAGAAPELLYTGVISGGHRLHAPGGGPTLDALRRRGNPAVVRSTLRGGFRRTSPGRTPDAGGPDRLPVDLRRDPGCTARTGDPLAPGPHGRDLGHEPLAQAATHRTIGR